MSTKFRRRLGAVPRERNVEFRLVVERQSERKRVALAHSPGAIADFNDPSPICILCENEGKTVVKYRGGGAVGKRAFVSRVCSALPLPDTDDAERASGETCGAQRDTDKRGHRHTQHIRHSCPPRKNSGVMLSLVVSPAGRISRGSQAQLQ